MLVAAQCKCRGISSAKFRQCTRRRTELFGPDSKFLQHAEVEVGERVVIFLVETNMTLVLETAAREEGRQVAGSVGGGVAEIAGEEHLGVVEERSAGLVGFGELVEEAGEVLVVFFLITSELLDFGGILTMVRGIVVPDLKVRNALVVVLPRCRRR